MLARMLCRSLSWIGCVGLAAAAAATAREGAAGVDGVVAVGEAGKGVMGVVGTWEEPRRLVVEVEVGVTAVDGLRGERTGSVTDHRAFRGSTSSCRNTPLLPSQHLLPSTRLKVIQDLKN